MTTTLETPDAAQNLFAAFTDEERAGLRQLQEDSRSYARGILATAKVAPDIETQTAATAAVHTGMAEFLYTAYRPSYENALAENLIQPVACARGCAFCCYLSVEVTIFSAVAIAAFIKNSRPDLALALRDTAPKVAGLSPAQRAASQVACAFLQTDKTCGVYAVRPTACGSYFSFDRTACEEDRKSGGTSGNIPVYGLPGVLNTLITDGLSVACEDQGLQGCKVELLSAVALIIDDPTAVSRWLAGQQVFTPYRRD